MECKENATQAVDAEDRARNNFEENLISLQMNLRWKEEQLQSVKQEKETLEAKL